MRKLGGILTGLVALLACAAAQPALAAFPYSDGSSGSFGSFHLNAGHVPNDLGGDDWKYAATPESGAPPTITSDPKELHGVRGAHIVDASAAVRTAWMTTTGRPDVTIAVLDSGIKWNDAEAMGDLRNKVRLNRGELPRPNHAGSGAGCGSLANAYDANGDGIFDLRDYRCDSRVHLSDPRRAGPASTMTPQDLIIAFSDGRDGDGNGFRDDIAGWDFLDNDNDPFDDVQYGHGTGEAEDSSSEANNGNGNSGSCPNCTFVPLRVGDSFVADANRFAQATLYAVDNGISVVQEALGTLNSSALARRAVDYAYRHGVTVIASAADEAAQHHNWPSSYAHTIVVNSVVKYDDAFTPANRSYVQFNGCTNFSTKVTLAIPSSSCSSNATGLAAGMAGLIYSQAKNVNLPPNSSCRRVNGSACQITPNEVRQLMASGSVGGAGQSDDVNFQNGPEPSCTPVALPGCTDPNRLFPQTQASRPVLPPGGEPVSRSYPARGGYDQYYGFGRVNMVKALDGVAAAKVPPEAEITSPVWYDHIAPARTSFAVRGQTYARGHSYTCKVEVAPGSEPNNTADFKTVSSSWCNGSPRNSRFDGTLANLDVAALKARFPSGTSFTGRASRPIENTLPDGPHQNNRPTVEPTGFVVRVVVTSGTLTGQDRRNLFLHRDADTLPGFPRKLASDGASSPALADVDGDNRNELVFGTSDGTLHALRSNGREVKGWPVRGDALPLHTGGRAFKSGEVPRGLSRGAMLASPAVGDVDHDGAPEVAIADMEGKVYVFRANGKLLWKRQANPRYSGKPVTPFVNVRRGKRYRTQHGFIASPVLANLDASRGGKLELIAAGMDRHVYAWHAGGKPVKGYPVLVIDRDKISSVNPTTHAPTFKPGIGDELNQGAIIDTPAVGNIIGDKKLEIVVGTNEEYPASSDGGLNAGLSSVTVGALSQLSGSVGLDPGNSRLYAIRAAGDPGAVSLSNSIFFWRFKVGVLLTELLPVVGEGVTGAPIIGKVTCGSDSTTPKVGVMPAVGLAYLLHRFGGSCYGKDGSGHDNPLATDFSTGGGNGKYDTPALAAVGHPAFGRIDASGVPSIVAPTAGLLRALDVGLNEYQGGQDLLAAWNTSNGQFRSGYPAPVNDLQFLTGPSVADIDGAAGEEVLGGTATEDLNAFGSSGAPASGAWPKFTGDWMVTNPVVGSFGSDETRSQARKDVVALTRSGLVFAFRTSAPACSPSSWPRFHHDNASSGDLGRDAIAPGRPYEVSRSGSAITFRAPGDDLLCGRAKSYQAVASAKRIRADFSGAKKIPAPVPAAPGTRQRLTIPAGAGRYLGLRAVDDQGNVGRAVMFKGRCTDRSRPRATLRRGGVRVGRKRLVVRGRASDRGCAGVKRVLVSVSKQSGKRCRFLTKRGKLSRRRSCSHPVWMRASGRKRWKLSVRRHLGHGSWRIAVRAIDGAGNRSAGKRLRLRLR